MREIKKKLTVGAVETTMTAAAAATAVAITAASPAAGVLAAIPIIVKTAVECLLDARKVAEFRQNREKEFFEEFQRQLELVISKISEISKASKYLSMQALSCDEVLILIEQFFDQAMKAPQRERRLMLAAAAAGSFRPDITTETKSRISRIIEQLEPSDLVSLRRLVQAAETARHRGDFNVVLNAEPQINVITLLRVGCLVESPYLQEKREIAVIPRPQAKALPPELRMLTDITPLAREVLTLLEAYPGDGGSKQEPVS